MKNNKYLSYALGILFSFCLIVTLLITFCGGSDLLDSGLL